MLTITNSRRIFLGCMACYNEGCIFGEWLDLNDFDSLEDLQEKAREIVTKSPCKDGEEYDIQDHEGFHGTLSGMYPSLSEVWAIHQTASQAEEEGIDPELLLEFANREFADDICKEDNDIVEKFQDAYRGEYSSLESWAYEFVDDCLLSGLDKRVKEQIEYFFDYQKYARDCEYSGEIFSLEHNGKTHVFATQY